MRLLLVEDEIVLSRALEEILKHNNYSVDVVHNGKDAVDYALATQYDGIILDIMMPIMDGLTALKILRSKKNTTPVLILTAKSEVDDKICGLDTGADDYLTKPFNTQELLARIRAITRRQDNIPDNKLVFGDLVLDRKTFEISCKDKKMIFTAKEFQVLELLMSNQNQVISAEKIMEKVWGFNSESEINVVWTYISYLRKKLSALQSTVKINAVRNLGYRLGKGND